MQAIVESFVERAINEEEVRNKRVLEVGSLDVNGSIRPILESYNPDEYVGIDIRDGPRVDLVLDAKNLVEEFGEESFDVVISTETLEHVDDWKEVVSNVKRVCKEDGVILLTSVSKDYPYHPTPNDFWRYELSDFEYIFSDCDIEILESELYSVFIKARKPKGFSETSISDYELYSIVLGKRTAQGNVNILHPKITKLKIEYIRNGIKPFVKSLLQSMQTKINKMVRFFYNKI